MLEAVIVDYARTIADPESGQLFPEAIPFLIGLRKRGLKTALVSRTADPEERLRTFTKMGLRRYFDVLEAFPADGVKDMTGVLEKLPADPGVTLAMGDRIKSEIVEGKRAGCMTLWVRQGKFADEIPETEEEKPDFTITSLSQALDIIDSLIR